MAKGKLILVCQFGGEFVRDDNGNMLYSGGDASAANVTYETPFKDLKLSLAETCDLDQKTVSVKYFLPGNKRNLITVSNDKDVKRMIDFHGDALTAEVFVSGVTGFNRSALDSQANREGGTVKGETMNDDNLPIKKEDAIKHGNLRNKKDAKLTKSPPHTSPAKRSSHAIESETDVTTSPADAVKKRRRTPLLKSDANGKDSMGSKSSGMTRNILELSGVQSSKRKGGKLDSKETKRGRKRGRKAKSSNENGGLELDCFHNDEEEFIQPSPLAICDDDISPENLVNMWKSAITGVGQEFQNVYELRDALQKYAIANRFVYKFKKNDTTHVIGICAAEEGCSWKLYAAWVPSTRLFKIKKLTKTHTCDIKSRKSAHPTKNWLVNTIKEKLQDSPHLKPKEIAIGLLKDFGVELNYTQIWRGIGDAREQLHGSLKESYNKLPWFCEKIIETNPGSISKLVIGEKKRFKSLFVSFYASLYGFQYTCRPLLFLESTSLKSKFGEVLFTANAVDGNDGFLPIAFSVVDVEDNNNWRWFLEQLKAVILNSQPITFVFDRDKNLKGSVTEVFEDAHIGYSIYHLLESLKRNVRGPYSGDGKTFIPVHFLAAAHAARPVGFRKSLEQIKKISPPVYNWAMKIEPEHWTTSSFKGERYNYITEDISGSYAKLMEDCRELPILQKIDSLIRKTIDAISDANLNASMWSTHLTQFKERKLEEETMRSRGLKVLISSDTLFEVRADSTHVVNISNWSCTCLGWKESGLPCRHALAVFALIGRNPYEFCSSYFTVEIYRLTYSQSIKPVPIDGPVGTENKDGESTQKVVEEVMDNDEGSNVNNRKEEVKYVVVGLEGNGNDVCKKGENGIEEEGGKEEGKIGKKIREVCEKGEVGIDEAVDNGKGSNVNDRKVEGTRNEVCENGVEREGGNEEDKIGKISEEACIKGKNGIEEAADDESYKKDDNGEVVELEDTGNNECEKGIEEEGGKEEGKMGKIREEYEDPKVFVLPPVSTKPAIERKEWSGWKLRIY